MEPKSTLDLLTWPFHRLEAWLASLSAKDFFSLIGLLALLAFLGALLTLLLLYLTNFNFLNWME